MTCEAYYDKQPSPSSASDRCAVPAIEAGTARAVALLGFSTTLFGVANLLITTWGIKRFGVKPALALQAFWPAVRMVVQNIGVMVGGSNGIIIVQMSQIVTIIGGPNGYLLALNTYVTEVTEHKHRTGYLGRLQGFCMFGSAIGFLVGGVLADIFTILTPFQVALALFLASTSYVLVCLPWIKPAREAGEGATSSSTVLGPLKTILPSKWIRLDGTIKTEYGAMILAIGSFLGVLATGYIPTLLQLYSTNTFGFGTKRNSYLTSMHAFLRGLFLTFAFPRIIATGRKWTEKRSKRDMARISQPPIRSSDSSEPTDPLLPALQDEEDPSPLPPLAPSPSNTEEETFAFDLFYTRFSLFIDALMTFSATFTRHGRDMYIIAALLPFGAGTASAAKGTILQMCPSKDRVDALSAIAFVEMIARLSTTFVFGLVFAAFASARRTELVFVCNAAVALVGGVILLGSRFPEKGSRRLDLKGEGERGDEEEVGNRA
jgi:hypothetical protein